jgi:outer membrane protein TolC
MSTRRSKGLWLALLLVGWSATLPCLGQDRQPDGPKGDSLRVPKVAAKPPTTGLLVEAAAPIDLPAALRLAGVQNPEILLAQERVEEAAALRQLAAAQLLPSLNAGTDVNLHNGPLQTSTGQIITVDRGSMYFGLGAAAVGAGTVTIPGIVWNGNLSDVYFGNLVARQRVAQQRFASVAVRNEVLLRVAAAFLELQRAEERWLVARQNRDDAHTVATITHDFAKAGQGRLSDANRAATELEQRDNDLLEAEGLVQTASARLAELLSLDAATRLHAAGALVVPHPLVADVIPLPELITIALSQRPELGERRAAIRAALLELDAAKLLPFSPNVILGYSAGSFGGGSDLVAQGIPQANGTILQQHRFGNFDGRQDVDAVVYWSLRNLGVGNLALVRLADSKVRTEDLRRIEVLDRIRAEVATAHARSHARFAQIAIAEHAVETSAKAFQQDLTRIRNKEGLPIELLDSMRLLTRSRYAYLDAIIDFNRAQFDLYVALGQPPADFLAHPVPANKGGR